MNTKKNTTENVLENEIYQIGTGTFLKFLLFGLIILIVSFVLNIPFIGNTSQYVSDYLKNNKACPIDFKSSKINYLLPPGITIKSPKIPGSCFNQSGKTLKLNKASLSFVFPSFTFPGLKFYSEITAPKTKIQLYPRVGIGKTDIAIKETKISTSLINQFTPFPNLLNGSINIDGIIKLKKQKLDDGALHIKSKDLKIPGQNLKGFIVPDLLFKTLDIFIKINKNKFSINKFEIGSQKSPIQVSLTGTLALNGRNFIYSIIDLGGKIRFSNDFVKQFSMIEIFTANAKKENGFYNISIKGPLMKPKTEFK